LYQKNIHRRYGNNIPASNAVSQTVALTCRLWTRYFTNCQICSPTVDDRLRSLSWN